jgi:putative ABC transport system substrate-binding protein
MFVSDAVGTKLVDNLARPGGNITGISFFSSELVGKRLQLLKEVIPGLTLHSWSIRLRKSPVST